MQSGLWVPCDPVEGAVTVNIGDAFQYWSDGRLRSTYHRVRMPRDDEYQVSPEKEKKRKYDAVRLKVDLSFPQLGKPTPLTHSLCMACPFGDYLFRVESLQTVFGCACPEAMKTQVCPFHSLCTLCASIFCLWVCILAAKT